MEPVNALGYLFLRLPLALLFLSGFVVYRLLAETALTDRLVLRAVRRSHGSVPRLMLAVVAAATGMSFFLPNAVSMLTLLPAAKALRDDLVRDGFDRRRATTALTLLVIYGSNIGGMGSLIGSPGNLWFIAALDFFRVPGRAGITFANWFLWSLPLVAAMAAMAWALVTWGYLPARLRRIPLTPPAGTEHPASGPQRRAALLFGLFLAYWIGEAVAFELVAMPSGLRAALALAFFSAFLALACLRRDSDLGQPLLPLPRLFAGLPLRGLLFVALLGAIFVAARLLHVDKLATRAFTSMLPAGLHDLAVLLALVLAVIFLTEVLSNTVVATAFFAVAHGLALSTGQNPLMLMLAVSLASTCAFMTPIATPCNGLAYGEMRETSLPAMLGLGFFLNLACAVVMSLWLTAVISLVYG